MSQIHGRFSLIFEAADVGAFFHACPNKTSSVWVSWTRKGKHETHFPIQTLDEKINTRFMWNETERTQPIPFYSSGSGVCVLRCFCVSRDSFCLYHATWSNASAEGKRGKWKNIEASANFFKLFFTSWWCHGWWVIFFRVSWSDQLQQCMTEWWHQSMSLNDHLFTSF